MIISIMLLHLIRILSLLSKSYAIDELGQQEHQQEGSAENLVSPSSPAYSSSERYIIVLVARLGLANRLRSLADWYQVAVISNRTLLVAWQATHDCNALFTDLFESGPERLKILPFPVSSINKEAISFFEESARSQNVTSFTLNETNMWADKHKSFVAKRNVFMSDTQAIITVYDGLITLDSMKCQQYLIARSTFYRSLVPIEDVRDTINQVKKERFEGKVMIGLHYRSHDKNYDWNVVPPLGGSNAAAPFGEGATLKDFEVRMRGILNAFTSVDSETGLSITNARFYIASNSNEAKNHFLSIFSETITLFGEYNRGTYKDIFFALVEWLILAECNLVLNTYGSSYAEEAAQMHRVPLVSIWNGVSILHNDLSMPLCGHTLYAKEYSDKTVDSSYTEETIDKRTIQSKSIRMDRCDHLKEWGLEEVYCTNFG
jgi:hypothetical protein